MEKSEQSKSIVSKIRNQYKKTPPEIKRGLEELALVVLNTAIAIVISTILGRKVNEKEDESVRE
jgi:F0F1-type ATP synthase membrane subunit b/b'